MHKLVKSLLLAAPATLVAVVAAQAADLPAYKSAPIEYVRVCDAYGAGFFYIPGTDTCLQVGGYVRFEFRDTPGHTIYNVFNGAVTQVGSAQDQTGMQVRGRIDVDARTQTQWGTVQTVVHLRGTNQDGVYNVGGDKIYETSATPGGNGSSTLTMERAYIRFAGLTAGVSSENFSTMPPYMYGPNIYAGFPNGIKQFAYTATFGGGFSATVAVESKGDFASDANAAGDTENELASGVTTPIPYAYGVTYTNNWDSGYVLVGNVRYDANWGYFQAAGLVTENTIDGVTLGASSSGTSDYNPLNGPTGLTAWAGSVSFRYNLPFISPGDQFHFQFAYTDGWLGAIMSSGSLNNLSNASGTGRFLGGLQYIPNDIQATSAAGGLVTSVGQDQAYGVYGMYTHYWTPSWRTNVQAGYMQVYTPAAAASAGVQEGNANVFDTGANLIWSPTKNFDIGVELDYIHLNQVVQNPTNTYVAAGEPGRSSNGVDAILRLERQF